MSRSASSCSKCPWLVHSISASVRSGHVLDLVGTLPDRTLALVVWTNQGHLLHEEAGRDIYVRAVQALAEKLSAEENTPGGRASWLATWLPGVHRRMVVE